MHGPRAAVGEQGEVARIVTLGDGDLLDGAHHAGDGDADDPLGELRLVDDSGHAPDEAMDGASRQVVVEQHLAGQGAVRGDPTQEQVRVRDGRLRPAAAVTRRTGIGPGASRPHPERPARIDPGHTSAARAYGVDLDLRRPVREPRDLLLSGDCGLELLDEADVGAGSPHVVGDQVAVPADPSQIQGRRDSSGGAGEHRLDREPRRHLGGHDPSAGGGDEDAARVAARGERRAQAREVAADLGPDVGVEHRGGEALVLPELRQDLR